MLWKRLGDFLESIGNLGEAAAALEPAPLLCRTRQAASTKRPPKSASAAESLAALLDLRALLKADPEQAKGEHGGQLTTHMALST